MRTNVWSRPGVDRRTALGLDIGAVAAPALAACGGASTSGGGGEDAVSFMSTQFEPVEERGRFEQILADRVTDVEVAFNSVDSGVFATQVQARSMPTGSRSAWSAACTATSSRTRTGWSTSTRWPMPWRTWASRQT